jgi:hypothetical protein
MYSKLLLSPGTVGRVEAYAFAKFPPACTIGDKEEKGDTAIY